MEPGKQDKKFIFAVCLLFYGFFFMFDGVHIAADSASYINMSISREPVYPMFLDLLRRIFGEVNYLNAAVFIQCLLAAFVAYFATTQIQSLFSLNRIGAILILLIQFGITILNRFFALRAIGYQNSIQTEGITLSIYMIWAVLLFRYVCKPDKKDLVGIFALAILMICTRKQMLMTLPVILVVLILMHSFPKVKLKKLFWIVVSVVFAFMVTMLISRAYNYAYRGSFVGYTDSSNTFFTNMLYAADVEDKELIENQELSALYEEIYSKLDQEQLNYKYAPEGLLNLETHYAQCYDLIAITTVQPMIKDYVRAQGVTDETQISIGADEARTQIMKAVLIDNLPQMAKVYLASVVHGLILTIAKQHPILNLYALLCYLLYLCMLGFLLKKQGKTDTVKVAALTGLLVITNVMLTAAVIFSQTRYMLYNMALCYIAAVLLAREVYRHLPENLLQFIKFGLVGGLNTVFSYLIYSVALLAGLHYQIGNVLAYIITVFVTFVLNGKWVFQKQENETRGFWMPLLKVYMSYAFTSLFLNSLLLFVQIEWLGMPKELAPLINLLITIPLNFILNKYWAFKKQG